MKRVVWVNKSNKQLCVTIPKNAGFKGEDIVSIEKKKIERIVYSPFGSDLFHYGHLQLLQVANKLGDFNICGVLTSEAIESYKEKPIIGLKERIAIISALRCVDMVMTQDRFDSTRNLKRIHNQFKHAKIILVHGSDLEKIPGEDYIRSIGGEVVKPDIYEKLSRENITRKMLKAHLKILNECQYCRNGLISRQREEQQLLVANKKSIGKGPGGNDLSGNDLSRNDHL